MDVELFLSTEIPSGFTSVASSQDRSLFVRHYNRNRWKPALVNVANRPSPSPVAAATPPAHHSQFCKLRERLYSTDPWPASFRESEYKSYTARDVALGLIDVFGWSVEADGKGEVGKVADILHIGTSAAGEDGTNTPYEYLLKVVRPCSIKEKLGKESWTTGSSNIHNKFAATEIKILIPIVEEFMQCIDPVKKCLLVKPPAGLIELAERPEAIVKLQPEIQLFCKRYAKFLEERFIGKKEKQIAGNADYREIVHSYMPTREQMYAVGRIDLVRQIKDAGGFLYVANVLGLKSARRPNGFWDDLRRLDFEIECFLLESWVKYVHKETGEVYFKNPVTNEVTLKKPAFTNANPSSATSDGGSSSKVMPRMKLLAKAGRWDLHHVIVGNGGYREVAQLLGRRLIRCSKKSKPVGL